MMILRVVEAFLVSSQILSSHSLIHFSHSDGVWACLFPPPLAPKPLEIGFIVISWASWDRPRFYGLWAVEIVSGWQPYPMSRSECLPYPNTGAMQNSHSEILPFFNTYVAKPVLCGCSGVPTDLTLTYFSITEPYIHVATVAASSDAQNFEAIFSQTH
jgi:hypothetical protein